MTVGSADLLARGVAALDGETRAFLGMRCGFHPDLLGISVAGFTAGEVGAGYRARLAVVLREQGAGAVDVDVSHLERGTDAAGRPVVRVVEDAFDLRPMIHALQPAARPAILEAARSAALEERVLAEVTGCLLAELDADRGPGEPPLDALPDDRLGALLRERARSSEGCTGRVNARALEVARTLSHAAVERLDLAALSLAEIERLMRLRPLETGTSRVLRPKPVAEVFAGGRAALPVNHATWALQNAIRDAILGHGWREVASGLPVHETAARRGAVRVSLRPPRVLPEDAPADIWERVRALDDLTSDALLVCLAHWAAGDDPFAPVWITADAILDARGVARMRRRGEPRAWQHGHRREDRLAAGRALAQLDSLWLEIVDVEVAPARGGRPARHVQAESRALAVLDRLTETDEEGQPIFLAARIVPGEWARAWWSQGLRQTGELARAALAYDPYRERPEKWLAKYLAFALRWNARRREPRLRLRVATLLRNAALEPDPVRPQRCRDRLEKALACLTQDGVIAGWGYEADLADLPARRWLERWTGTIVWLEKPHPLAPSPARRGDCYSN